MKCKNNTGIKIAPAWRNFTQKTMVDPSDENVFIATPKLHVAIAIVNKNQILLTGVFLSLQITKIPKDKLQKAVIKFEIA